MVCHAFWVDEFPHNLHEIDGQHCATLHQFILHGVFRWHLDLHLELGRAPPPYSTSRLNHVTTQIVFHSR